MICSTYECCYSLSNMSRVPGSEGPIDRVDVIEFQRWSVRLRPGTIVQRVFLSHRYCDFSSECAFR